MASNRGMAQRVVLSADGRRLLAASCTALVDVWDIDGQCALLLGSLCPGVPLSAIALASLCPCVCSARSTADCVARK